MVLKGIVALHGFYGSCNYAVSMALKFMPESGSAVVPAGYVTKR